MPSETKQRRRTLRPHLATRGAGMQMARDFARLGIGARLVAEDQAAYRAIPP